MPQSKNNNKRLLMPNMWFVLFTIFLDSTGFGIILPIMPKLLETITQSSIGVISIYSGLMLFIFAISQFIFSPILGALSDKYGRKPILIISMLGLGIDYIILFFANNLFWLFIGRLIAGIMGSSVTTATAYAADISDEKNRAKNFGLIEAAFGIGFVFGPVIGGILGNFLGIRIPFLFAAILSLANATYGIFLIPESLDKNKRSEFLIKNLNPFGVINHFLKIPKMRLLIISYFLLHLAVASFHSVWTFVMIEKFNWSPDTIGYALGWFGLSMAIMQAVFAGWIINLIGDRLTIIAGTIINIVIYALVAFSTQGWQIFVSIPIFELGWISITALISKASKMVKDKDQGKLQGVLTSLVSFTNILGAIILTQVFYLFSDKQTNYYFPGAPFLLSAILATIGLITCFKWFKKP